MYAKGEASRFNDTKNITKRDEYRDPGGDKVICQPPYNITTYNCIIANHIYTRTQVNCDIITLRCSHISQLLFPN